MGIKVLLRRQTKIFAHFSFGGKLAHLHLISFQPTVMLHTEMTMQCIIVATLASLLHSAFFECRRKGTGNAILVD